MGSAHYVVLEDGAGRYAGLVAVARGATPRRSAKLAPIAELARLADATLAPEMGAKEALRLFEARNRKSSPSPIPTAAPSWERSAKPTPRAAIAEALDIAARGVLDGG